MTALFFVIFNILHYITVVVMCCS